MIRSFQSSENLLSENTSIIPKYPVNREISSLEQAQVFWEEYRDFWTKRQKNTGYPAYATNYDMSAWALIIQDEEEKISFLDNDALDSHITLRKIECVSYFLMDFIKKNTIELESPKEIRVSIDTSSDGDSRKIYAQVQPIAGKDFVRSEIYFDTGNALTRLLSDESSPFSCLKIALTEEVKKQGYGYVALDSTSVKTIQNTIAESLQGSMCYDLKNKRDLLRDVKKIETVGHKPSSPSPNLNRF